ncbi:MAG: hypothetical protein AB7G15_01470 [Alphaproteobacteria bacterium]
MQGPDDTPFKRDLEKRLPHCVELPAPPDGFGPELDAMDDWCESEFRPGAWEQYSGSFKTRAGPFKQFARFYFKRAEDAARFRVRWLDVPPADED